MPITITVPGTVLFDDERSEFYTTPKTVITLEHSLLSISKWEAVWHKAYMTRDKKTEEEMRDYLRCMTISPNSVDPLVYKAVPDSELARVAQYIEDPMTATTIRRKDKRGGRGFVTNELIYYWMTELNIPFDPCQKWHLNRLMTLIEVCAAKKEPPKKISPTAQLRNNYALNKARRARYHTSG